MAVTPDQLTGQTVKGWLKKYQEGWGFMCSDAFVGDLFVHARENPEIPKYPPNTEFYFVVSKDSRGKPMATNAAPANPDAAVTLPQPKTTLETGERLIGLMRTFQDHWGFIRTDNGQDYYFHEKTIETYGGELPTVGSRVSFSTAPDNQKPDKVMAVCLQTITPGTGVSPDVNPRKRNATDAGMAGGMGGLPTTVEQLEAQALSFLPSARLFQLAEMKMRMEIPAQAGTLQGYGAMPGMY
jgi:cold shock CspA family protein